MTHRARRMIRAAVVVAAATALVGCAAIPTAPNEPTTVTVPSLVGSTYDVAKDQLEDAGLEVEYVDAFEDRNVWVAQNWTVQDQDPPAGDTVEPGDTVTLTIAKDDDEERLAAKAEREAAQQTPSGLKLNTAWSACDRTGDDLFRYGFNAKWFWDGEYAVSGDEMHLLAGGWVRNEFGTKMNVTFSCIVTGTNDAPEVVDLSIH